MHFSAQLFSGLQPCASTALQIVLHSSARLEPPVPEVATDELGAGTPSEVENIDELLEGEPLDALAPPAPPAPSDTNTTLPPHPAAHVNIAETNTPAPIPKESSFM